MPIVSATKVAGVDYDELHSQVGSAGMNGASQVADVLKHAVSGELLSWCTVPPYVPRNLACREKHEVL